MKIEFPSRFDLDALSGSRAKAFSRREDSFQQLIGEALQLATGFRAHFPATGGHDGLIDAWADGMVDSPSPFADLNVPMVVECKDHDDSRPNYVRNVFSGWAKVQRRLREESERQWTGLSAPWRNAKSYAYVVSAVLHQAARDDLTKSIREFFKNIPPDRRPPINNIRVLDWNDVRPWLSSITKLSDAWMGTGSTAILTHSDYVASLLGFREYLLSSKLPFVAPRDPYPVGPQALFETLNEQSETAGILVVGAGGVGKTRTGLEVAQLAESARWRVLHPLPTEATHTMDELAHLVLVGNQSTLLILDYIDQMPWLNFGILRRSLIPQAQQRGISVKLFANCRPASQLLRDADLNELFEIVELKPDIEHRRRIIHQIIAYAAPRCLNHFGEAALVRACGHRPIIALLVARALEQRYRSGQTQTLDLTGLRTGNLLRWLRKRLADDGMKIDLPASPLEASSPPAPVVVAAAILVCTPNSEEILLKAGTKVARHLNSSLNVNRIITTLVSLGWLEREDAKFVCGHDVIVDEVFDQVIREGSFVRDMELNAILSVWSVSTEMIGRLGTALKRVMGAIDDHHATTNLNTRLATWVEQNATSVTNYLDSRNVRTSSAALAALLDSPALNTISADVWNILISPWLTKHQGEIAAHRILHKILRQDEVTLDAINIALAWTRKFVDSFQAQFVLGPLLERPNLGNVTNETIELALQWLGKFSHKLEAQFVFSPLLRRNDLDNEASRTAIKMSLAWLERFPLKLEAQFVLNPLLQMADLGNNDATIRTLTLKWLKRYRKKLDASFLLATIVQRDDLRNNSELGRLVFSWLKRFRGRQGIGYVLEPLLAQDLGDKSKDLIKFTLEWLRKFYGKYRTGFVVGALLKREDLGDKKPAVIEMALSYLHKFSNQPWTGYVIGPLLSHPDLEDRSDEIISSVVSWLPKFTDKIWVSNLLVLLLKREDLGAHSPVVISATLDWLTKHPNFHLAPYIIGPLLRREDLGDMAPSAIDLALVWLNRFPDNLDAGFVLAPLLRQVESHDMSPAAIERALSWLDGKGQKTDYVINRILRNTSASPEQWTRAANAGLIWLRRTCRSNQERDHTINSLLKRYETLDSDSLKFVVNEALQWLRKNSSGMPATRVRISLRRAKLAIDPQDPLFGQINNMDPFGAFVSSLEAAVLNKTSPFTLSAFNSACARIQTEARGSSQSAGFAIPFLLVLSCRLGQDAVIAALGVCRPVIEENRSFTKLYQQKLSRLCWDLLHQGFFPSREQAIQVFYQLGLREPIGDPRTFGKSILSNPPISLPQV